jgi:hypothetical protein
MHGAWHHAILVGSSHHCITHRGHGRKLALAPPLHHLTSPCPALLLVVQTFPHGSMASESKDQASMGEKVAEAIASTDQVRGTSLAKALWAGHINSREIRTCVHEC